MIERKNIKKTKMAVSCFEPALHGPYFQVFWAHKQVLHRDVYREKNRCCTVIFFWETGFSFIHDIWWLQPKLQRHP